MTFEWIPGQGINQDALARMKEHFHKPEKPPYEAWFMSGINYHTFFLEQAPEELDLTVVERCLDDYCSGIKCFGRFEEWVLWYQYLLPLILPRFVENVDLLLTLINYFINLYTKGVVRTDIHVSEERQRELARPDYEPGIFEEYLGFRDDILSTLPQVIMEGILWQNGDLSKNYQWRYWTDPLYASLFFCLMYLTPEEISTWVASIAAIDGELWRDLIKEWLAGLRRFFQFVTNPASIQLEDIPEQDRYEWEPGREITLNNYLELANIGWAGSWTVLNGSYVSRDLNDYIPAVNIETFWREVAKYPVLQAE